MLKLLRALIVDPDLSARREMAKLLDECHFDTVHASDGIGALRFAADGAIDLLIADIDTRDLDALHLLHIVRRGAFGLIPPPVIICSGLLHEATRSQHPALRGVTHLAKPFTPTAFAVALDTAFPVE